MCVDFREVNKRILPDRYPLPRVDDLIEGAGQGTVTHFSTMDLAKGFHQIEIEKDSQDKMAFVYPNGFYKWLRVPFGIQTAPAFFQRVMDKVLRPLEKEKVECYIDDLIIKGTSFEQHLQMVRDVLQKLSDAGLMVSLAKSHFLRATVNYLGYLVSSQGLLPGE